MTTFPKLARPPIIEALVDVQVQPQAAVSMADLRQRLPASLSQSFPTIEEMKKFEGSIRQGPSGAQLLSKDFGVVGLILRNQESTKALQVRIDGFALSHLQPYDSFEAFREEARQLWGSYIGMVGESRVLRIVLRYVNIIDCHRTLISVAELGEFLTKVPSLPDGVPAGLNGFGVELVTEDSGHNVTTTVRYGLLKNLQTLQHGINVDIEVVQRFAEAPDSAVLWQSVEALRPIKNAIFFDLIQSKILDGYR